MLVAPQFSRAQKREVTTYVVTPRDRGSLHCSIQQAIDKADPYSRIVLGAGQYFESVTLQQPLEIVGEEGVEMPEISARGVCLSLLGEVETYFENVKFTTKTSQFAKSASRNAAQTSVRITGGRPQFVKCVMTSVFVGGEAEPTISKCVIQGSTCCVGLTVAEGAGGTYSDCTINNHFPFAVHVKSRQVPIFQNNCIFQDPKFRSQGPSDQYQDRQGGVVLISQDSVDSDDVSRSIAPRFLNNRIGDEVALGPHSTTTFDVLTDSNVAINGDFEQFFCERRTVVVENGCCPYFEENTITGGHVGITLSTGSSGTFVNNNISHASVAGIHGGSLSTTIVRFNVISKCSTGIFAQNTSVTFTQNSVKENIGSGLLLLVGCEDRFHMDGNSFVGNDVGICVRPSAASSSQRVRGLSRKETNVDTRVQGEALLEKNYVCLNKSAGIVVIGEGFKLTMEEVEIGANGRFGAYCSYGACPTFRNVRFDRGAVGLVMEQTANPMVYGCHFVGQTDASIVARDRGLGSLRNNSITGFAKVGVLIDDGGSPIVAKNNFASNAGTGVMVSHGGSGEIFDNTIDMVAVGISIASFGDPMVQNNVISSCTETGIYVFDEGCGCIIDNVVTACSVGIACSMGGECVVRGNTIKSCMRFGIVSGDGSRMLVEKNVIEGNIGGNVLLDGLDSQAVIKGNTIANSSGFGVRSCRGAGGQVIGNRCSSNRDGGLSSASGGTTTFEGNICSKERGPGISIKEEGRGRFINNKVEDGESFGVELFHGSAAEIEGGVITRNAVCGVLVHNGCGGSFTKCQVTLNGGPGIQFQGISSAANTVFHDTTISGNAAEGVRILDHCALKLTGSRVSNHQVGIFFQCSGSAILDQCVIEDNNVGAKFEKRGTATVSNCTFRRQCEADVEFAGDGRGCVSKCTLGEGSTVAVLGSFNGGGDVTDCTIEGASAAGAKFLKGSYTTLLRTVIGSCSGFGILCEEMSLPTVQTCTIRRCELGNVKLLTTASPYIRSNTIEHSRTSGILSESRNGYFEANVVQHSAEHGIRLSEPPSDDKDSRYSLGTSVVAGRRKSVSRRTARPTDLESSQMDGAPNSCNLICLRNVVRNNYGAGIFFDPGTTADLVENDVDLNAKSGIVISAGCSPSFGPGNKIHRNSESGIVLRSQCSPCVRSTLVFQNDPCNIVMEERSGGFLEDCDIYEAVVDGIQTLESIANIRHCRISGCAQGCGIAILGPNRHLLVQECEFFGNSIGVCADVQGAYARFTKNCFRHNMLCGFRIENGGCPELTENKFEQGTLGVVLKDGAGGLLTNNLFKKNAEGLSITGIGIVTICRENSFDDNDKGIVLRQTDNFVVEKSVFGPNESAAISCEDGAKGFIRENKFHNGQRGVLVTSSASPLIVLNEFFRVQCGVEMVGRSTPRVERNWFSECDTGCRCSSAAAGVSIATNMFHGCVTAGVMTEKLSNPTVQRNVFADCSLQPTSSGVLCADAGCGLFNENDFHRNAIAVTGGRNGNGEFSRCMFHDNRVGASFDHGAQTSFERCTFFNNALGDVISKHGGAPSFKNCFFSKSQGSSVQLSHAGAGSIVSCMFRDCQSAFLIEDCGAITVTNNYITNAAIGFVFRRACAGRGATIARNVLNSCDVGIQAGAYGGAMMSQNFVTLGEVGAVIEKRSQIKLTNNTFFKLSKIGIHLKGNGNVALTNNLVQECTASGLVVAIPMERGGTLSEADVSSTVVLENTFVGSRTNVQVVSGDVTLRKNHVQRGEFGITLLPDARATVDGNVVCDCSRNSFTLGSRHCSITNNLFYSLNDGGAFETSHDASPNLSKDNCVYNSCACKLAPPPSCAPAKVVDVDTFRAKDVLSSLQQALLTLHTTELPQCPQCGCSAIPGSFERRPALEEVEDVESLEKKRSGIALFRRASGAVAALPRRRRSSTTSVGGDPLARSDSLTEIPVLSPVPPQKVPPTGGSGAASSFRRASTSAAAGGSTAKRPSVKR